MGEPLVLEARENGVVRLTLNRPARRNALSRELLGELVERLRVAGSSPEARLVVLSGAGPAFCAGMDLGQMQETAARPDAAAIWQADAALYRDAVVELFRLRVPTLAVVPGPALAGGLGLVLACDLVLAADEATFALPEPKRGITAAIVTPLLAYRAGPASSSYLLLSGRSITAGEARQFGICHELAPSADLAKKTDELTKSILSGAPGALAASKQQLQACAAGRLLAQIDEAMAASAKARESAEAREGLAAFLEKRPPIWSV